MPNYLFMTEVTQPILIKNGNLFFLATSKGEIFPDPNDGLGLFCNDTRYLNRCELRVGDQPQDSLMSSSAAGRKAVLHLTNPKLQLGDGAELDAQAVGIRLEFALDAQRSALVETMSFTNFTRSKISLPVSLLVGADFEDIFALRGVTPGQRGKHHPPRLDRTKALFRYEGADKITRVLEVRWSRPVTFGMESDGVRGTCTLELEPQVPVTLVVSFHVAEAEARAAAPAPRREQGTLERGPSRDGSVRIESDNALLDETLSRSLRDLRLLWSDHGGRYIAGGVPWFAVPFGRDGVIAALECLMFQPDVAADTARLLARHQGRRRDESTGEQPGKILHELRIGEMAHLHEISQAPNYASVDSTPLFLILIASYTQWTGDLRLFDELKRNVDAALRWIDEDGDANRDGYVEYGDAAQIGRSHQGWKDSASAIVNRDGSDAIPPISLVEVQGYVYLAKSTMAELYRRAGHADVADRLVQEAAGLRERFNRDFWMEEEGCYCLALQGDSRQVSVIASNPGHALWSGIADEQKARRTTARLMQADMFSGWGIRSLSKDERAYNPILYHMGSVWPFDNALIVAGLRRYGLDDAARRVFAGMFDAASHFAAGRLPEFFIGFDREPDTFPGRCPSSDPLQAWSSGALPFMLQALLGIEPNAAERQLRIVRPILPDGVDRLTVRGMTVGSASVDLLFEGDGTGTVSAVVLNKEGDLTVALG